MKSLDNLVSLATAVTYFYFHWQYFLLAKKQARQEQRRPGFMAACFVVNYLFFYFCSLGELPLFTNWWLFAVLLFLETFLYNGRRGRCALFSTLIGSIAGLLINLFCRSIIAIIIHQPLQNFDNHISSVSNVKWIPVLLGFLLGGAVLHLLGRPRSLKRTLLIVDHPQHQVFLLEMMAGLFFYLSLNLLLYSTPLNDLLLKVWSLKSCLFCVVGFYLAMRYTWRICELTDYRQANRYMAQQLQARRQEEERLSREASLDVLTGVYNRASAEEQINAALKQGRLFALCFIDLDGLKQVNDQYGHPEGDRYLLAVSRRLGAACRQGQDLLFRYGGDEFILLFREMSAPAAEKRAQEIQRKLLQWGEAEGICYPLSFSYGVTDSSEAPGRDELIRLADQKMYAQKQQKQKARRE